MKTLFYRCPICGNIIVKMVDSGVVPVCCGSPMTQLVPKSQESETASEKHVPVVRYEDNCTLHVEVGSGPHPMIEEHHICFIYLETENGGQFRWLSPNRPAAADFCGCNDKPVAVYEYCNLHGLWVTTNIPDYKSRICCPS